MTTFSALLALAPPIHQGNIDAGWWKQERGPRMPYEREGPLRTIPRNIGELLCLVHSEISEADEGQREDLMDDKLPHRRMFEVELGDAAIRVLDILGYYASVGVPSQTLAIVDSHDSHDQWLLGMHRLTSAAMERFRKGDLSNACRVLVTLLRLIFDAAEWANLDLMGAIEEKRAFNAQRADHRLENRAQIGGKQF